MFDNNNLCYGCMEITSQGQFCPNCGYSKDAAETESLLHLSPGTVLQDRYLIGRVLGQGGFGITYLAWDNILKIKLALKEYLPQQYVTRIAGQHTVTIFNPSYAEYFSYGLSKFLDEARTLAQFTEHPGVVSVRDYFEANNTAYLVMSYLEGITLKEYLLQSSGKISVNEAFHLFRPVLDALSEVHNAGVLHRDISPENLLVTDRKQVVLIDFGAARQAMGEKSRSLSVIMKAGYSPLEQYQSKGNQGPWTDIYALAATIYRSICGYKPAEALDRLEDDNLVSPSALGVAIEPFQEKTLLKALALKSQDRYQTIKDFAEDLYKQKPKYKQPESEKVRVQKTNKPKKHYSKAIAVFIALGFVYFVVNNLLGINVTEDLLSEQGESVVLDDSDRSADDEDTSNDTDETGNFISASSDYIRGNSIGNIINVGIAAEIDDYVVYRRTENGGGIFKLNLSSSEQRRLTGDDAWNINASDGWVYYSNRDQNWNVFKVRLDGTEKTRINIDDSGNLQLVDDWLYYRNDDDDNTIYKIRIDGSERTKVNNEASYFLNVIGDWIFYQNRNDGGKIYRIRTDGSSRTIINEDDSWNINVTDEWIYYTNADHNNAVYRIRFDGSDRMMITADSSDNLNVIGDWLYYRNDDDNSHLYRIRPDGTERTQLNSDQSYFFSVIDEWIFYQNRSDNRIIYKMRLDGTEKQAVY